MSGSGKTAYKKRTIKSVHVSDREKQLLESWGCKSRKRAKEF